MAAEPSTNQAWFDLAPETALEPDLPICDPHHHLWHKWSHAVQKRYLVEDMLADLSGGHNIVSTVFIECGESFRETGPESHRPLGETEFVVAQTKAHNAKPGATKIAAGIVATVDFRIGDVTADVLDQHIALGDGRLRGIRRSAFWHESPAIPNHRTDPPEGLYLREDFRRGFRHLASRKLSFEIWCAHTQIREATDLARAYPDTIIILDHFGGPCGIGPYAGKADEVFADWKLAIDDLAKCPNVMAKLGGLNMEVNGYGWHLKPKPPSSAELCEAYRRYFDYTIERFGVARCMFESNFPVDKLSCSYTVLWNAFKIYSKSFSSAERAALFHETATRVYRL
jgi:predicted TIM-barrel fold metal-dependent hydrolase